MASARRRDWGMRSCLTNLVEPSSIFVYLGSVMAAEDARHAVVDAVRATAETLDASLEQMKVVEEMRRRLREVRDVKKLDSH